MDGHEEVCALRIREGDPLLQGDIDVPVPRHDDFVTIMVDKFFLQNPRDSQNNIFFPDTMGADGSGIFASMAWVKADDKILRTPIRRDTRYRRLPFVSFPFNCIDDDPERGNKGKNPTLGVLSKRNNDI